MKKYKSIIEFAFMIMYFLLVIIAVGSQGQITQLKQDNKELENIIEELEKEIDSENIELEECPLCGNDVSIKPVNDSFYIKCDNCELETTFFDSKSKLIQYWNGRGVDYE